MNIAILGFGREGKSVQQYFQAKGDDCTVFYYVLEGSESPVSHLEKSVKTIKVPRESTFEGLLDEFDLVVRSADILPTRIHTTATISSATNEFFKACPAPIIGVTGTKGKGTTSTLIARFLEAAGKTTHLVGNIGVAPLEELANIKTTDWVVFELSSFQLMDLSLSPQIAVHLALSPDHLDYHTDMAEYVAAKAMIFNNQEPDDVAVYYAGSEIVTKSAMHSAANTKIPYDRNGEFPDGLYVQSGQIMFGDQVVAAVSDVQLIGEHMLDNVCAAIATTWQLIGNKQIYPKVLKTFTGLPHRLQLVAEKNGVRYVDDSISTNPDTAIAAIRAFKEPKILILGGSDKGNDFAELAREIPKNNVKQVFLIGQMADSIAQSLKQTEFNQVEILPSMAEVVQKAAHLAQPGDVVLLSPACASFGMFNNYAERGDQFVAAAQSL